MPDVAKVDKLSRIYSRFFCSEQMASKNDNLLGTCARSFRLNTPILVNHG